MPRPLAPQDVDDVIDTVLACRMFDHGDEGFLREMLTDYFATGVGDGHGCVVEEASGTVVAVAYYQPKPACDRVWDLTMIAVHPDHQRRGHASALLRHVEDRLRADGQRLLLIDTSAQDQYERSRRIYVAAGYRQAAHLADYWSQGDDLIVFSKQLTL